MQYTQEREEMQAKKESLVHEPMEFFHEHAEKDIKHEDQEELRTEKTLGRKFLAGNKEKEADGSLLSHINKRVEENIALDDFLDDVN